MRARVHVLPLWAKNRPKGAYVVPTVAKAGQPWQELSPFLLGPVQLWSCYYAKNVENGWQFSKVYSEHVNKDGSLKDEYFQWAEKGWADPKAHRYPMGKGRKPLFSFWEEEALGYIEARKRIYVPLYARAVQHTQAWWNLMAAMEYEKDIVLLDYDAYDHRALGMSLTEVLNNPDKKMGHAFVLAMLLTNSPALKEIYL